MEALDTYWPEILGSVRQKVQQQTFDTWFLPLEPEGSTENGGYRVLCPNSFYLDWFSEHHLHLLDAAGSAFFGRPVHFHLAVNPRLEPMTELFHPETVPSGTENGPLFRGDDRTGGPGRASGADGGSGPDADGLTTATSGEHRRAGDHRGGATVTTAADLEDIGRGPRLHPQLRMEYIFENFVVGSGSNLAFAAATAVARAPGKHYNPLFIHGGVGLGKTHLLHAIGNQIRRTRPQLHICVVTAEQFINDLVHAIQRGRQYDFKQRYRTTDVLLVDDVQFMAKKESTQEEFFHTFNDLYNDGKLIVLTSDRTPKEISTIELRLRTRFEWGLIVDIQPPNFETRIAILRRKVEIHKISIDDDVIEFIAENITDNIRRLEGALIRLLAFASLTGRDINLEMASEVLSSIVQSESTGPLKIVDIQKAVAAEFGFTVDQLKSKRRTQDLARARQIAMYLARDMTGSTLNQIGRAFGNRDHTTVAHACQKVHGMFQQDPAFRGVLRSIIDRLRERKD
ncbi:MAG: chromosomal replication initiator protein DnaA [Candidatus Krumholzibacteriia bacterium]